jgi:hypothetical protein
MNILKKIVSFGMSSIVVCLYAQNYSIENGQFNSASGYSVSALFSEGSVVGSVESGVSSNSEFQVESGAILIPLGTTSGINSPGLLPLTFSVKNNYPNPFNARTQIVFTVPESSNTQVEIYDCKGQSVRYLVNKPLDAGEYTLEWDGLNFSGIELPSGLYIANIQSGNHSGTIKMLLLK